MEDDLEITPMANEDQSMFTLIVRSADGKPIPDQVFIEALRSFADFLSQQDSDEPSRFN